MDDSEIVSYAAYAELSERLETAEATVVRLAAELARARDALRTAEERLRTWIDEPPIHERGSWERVRVIYAIMHGLRAALAETGAGDD